MKRMKQIYYLTGCLLIVLFLTSCEEFLNARPDRSLAIPKTLQDLRAILDSENSIHSNYPTAGDIASDYYYLSDADWKASDEFARNIYIWHANVSTDGDWSRNYGRILDANVVLDHVESVAADNLTEQDRKWIKGTALFVRSWTFYHIAQLYAPPYEEGKATGLPGIPLKMESDIGEEIKRASLEKTYEQIITDFESAADLLPSNTAVATRPNKAAAYAALARVALIMGDYVKARDYATNSLDEYAVLIDYNTLDTNATKPIEVLNEEVLFHCLLWNGGGGFNNNRAMISSDWLAEYEEGDLRRKLFFEDNGDGTFGFKGDYGRSTTIPFSGLAADEVYLTRAEAFARLGDKAKALADLNTLLIKRWKTGAFVPRTAATADDALKLIISERRKELIYRGGIRWNDLRRLNKDPRFAKTLRRTVDGQTYELPPGDKRYTFLIPPDIISHSGIQQNER